MHNVIQPAPRWVQNVPVTLVGSSTSDTTTIDVVSGVQNGDLLILFAGDTGTAPSLPSGWTSRKTYSGSNYFLVCTRVASSEPASYTVANSDLLVMVAYRNVTGVDVVGNFYETSAFTNQILAPSITPTRSGILLGFWAMMEALDRSLFSATVSDMTRIGYNADVATGSEFNSLAIYAKGQTPTSTGDKTLRTNIASFSLTGYGMLMQIY